MYNVHCSRDRYWKLPYLPHPVNDIFSFQSSNHNIMPDELWSVPVRCPHLSVSSWKLWVENNVTCLRGKCQKRGFSDISFSRLRYQQNGQMQLPVHLRQSSPEESSALHHFWATERGANNSGSSFRCRHMLSFSYCDAVFAGGYSIFRPLLFPKYACTAVLARYDNPEPPVIWSFWPGGTESGFCKSKIKKTYTNISFHAMEQVSWNTILWFLKPSKPPQRRKWR